MNIAPSTATLGATVTDVSLNALSDGEWQTIEDAFHEYAVLVFSGANLTQAEHIAFSHRFGPLERTLSQRADKPEISLISNVAGNGEVARPDDTLGLFLKGNRYWHTDSSFKKVGAKVSLLRAVEVPETGGDTEWADMRAAWDALDPDTRQRLEGLVAMHSYAYSHGTNVSGERQRPRAVVPWATSGAGPQAKPKAAAVGHSQGKVGGIGLLNKRERDALPPVRQPVVRVHPATGRKNLYVGRHASHIVGMPREEGRALLDRLTQEACQAPRIFRHHWRAGDIVAWDNRCVLHRGHPWPFDQPRVMKRTTVAGDGDNPWTISEAGG